MAEAVIIDRVEDSDYQGKAFKKVTDKTGKTFNVKYGREGKLKDKWDLLVPGNAIEITWGDYNGKPFVQDFKVVAEASEVAKLEPRKLEPIPLQPGEEPLVKSKSQEIAEHVWWKELGECIRAKDIDTTKPAGKGMRTAYYAKMMSVLDIKIEDK